MSTSPISGPGSFASPGPSSPNTTSAPLATPPRGAQAATPDKPGPGASASQVQSQNRSQGAATAHTLQHHHAAATRQPDQISATQFATSMVTTYDGGAHSRNEAADRNNTLPVLQTARLSMTGLPPGQVKKNLDEMQFAGALAQMSEARRVQFAQRANALRTAPQDQYAAMQRSLRNDVNRELGRVRADPVSRMQAVFNAPVGIALLGENGQQQMAALRNAQTQMNAPGATPAQREQAFAGGSGIKTRLQSQILQKSQDIYAAQQKKWADSMARVNQMLDDAQKYQADTIQLPGNSDDPEWDENTRKPAYAKTFPYQSVMEKLLSPDGYSQQERGHSTGRTLPPEDRARDLLTFQQGMSDPGSDIHRRVMKLEQQALSTMAAPGPDLDAGSPATTLSDVAAHPPQYDQNYVQNLAAGYRGVLRDTELQNRVMLRKPIPGLADQVLYGIGRFAADLSPIPGLDWFANQLLDVQFPDHGGLSDQQVKNVDMGAMFTGLLLGRGEPEGEALLKPPVVGHGEAPGGGPGEVHGTGSGTESRTDGGTGPTQEPPPGMTAPQAGPAANGPQGQPPQGGAGSAFTPGGMPKGYALNRAPASYGPSATPGVYADAANGQKFIIADGQAFAVRYDKENATYRIYDPANPSRPTYPVRRDPETGRWEIHNNVGLQGGMDNGSSSSSGTGTSSHSGSPPSSASSDLPPFADSFHVMTSTGSAPSFAMMETLNPGGWHSTAGNQLDNPAYVNQYKAAFDALPAAQRRAIRDWTHLDIGGGSDSDRYSSGASYEGNNFELNQQLYSRVYEANTAVNARRLQKGIDRLPKPAGQSRLLRIADVAPDYASHFAPGDYVTNSPAFMSASSKNEYANATLKDEAGGSGPDHAHALYDIEALSATPFIKPITTLADEESEWLFRPNTVFRVEEIATATPNDPQGTRRIGMRLVEVPITEPTYAKNIYTGELELVYPPGMQPAYTTLRPTTNPPIRQPVPQPPHLPPAPTAGDPNVTAPKRV
ncbi:hypothetical protein BCh11DRAFT_00011 [Burkholderia sp. Ch1-1]|nr:hypothetical protein BCh11DRAFT_00011 [Burkholderia sp. Ch1-1]